MTREELIQTLQQIDPVFQQALATTAKEISETLIAERFPQEKGQPAFVAEVHQRLLSRVPALVNQVLPSPSNPRLAREYTELATRKLEAAYQKVQQASAARRLH